YKNDPDPVLRELALKAGRYIKGTTGTSPAVGSTPSTPPFLSPSPQPTVKPSLEVARVLPLAKSRIEDNVLPTIPLPAIAPIMPPPNQPTSRKKEITYRERQLAKGRLDTALGMISRGETEKALTELIDAVYINPDLENDTL